MPRFKDPARKQARQASAAFDRQILPSCFQYSLIYLVEYQPDPFILEEHYHSDDTAWSVHEPAIFYALQARQKE